MPGKKKCTTTVDERQARLMLMNAYNPSHALTAGLATVRFVATPLMAAVLRERAFVDSVELFCSSKSCEMEKALSNALKGWDKRSPFLLHLGVSRRNKTNSGHAMLMMLDPESKTVFVIDPNSEGSTYKKAVTASAKAVGRKFGLTKVRDMFDSCPSGAGVINTLGTCLPLTLFLFLWNELLRNVCDVHITSMRKSTTNMWPLIDASMVAALRQEQIVWGILECCVDRRILSRDYVDIIRGNYTATRLRNMAIKWAGKGMVDLTQYHGSLIIPYQDGSEGKKVDDLVQYVCGAYSMTIWMEGARMVNPSYSYSDGGKEFGGIPLSAVSAHVKGRTPSNAGRPDKMQEILGSGYEQHMATLFHTASDVPVVIHRPQQEGERKRPKKARAGSAKRTRTCK